MTVLVVEADEMILEGLTISLEPDGDGYAVCRKIREKAKCRLFFLMACDDEFHTVLALEQGADDYIVKPFRIRELLVRMKVILRRSEAYTNQ